MVFPWTQLSILAMLAGAVLRTLQYLARSSLWVDEAALARNVIARPVDALIQPLDFAQYAPIGFLLAQKAITVLGTGELVLRAIPFASSLVALVLFASIAARLLTAPAATVAIVMFSLGSPFIYFGSQAKQYSSDVAVTLALVLVVIVAVESRRSRTYWLAIGLAGLAACFFSHPAMLVVCALGAALLVAHALGHPALSWPRLMAAGAPWALGVVAGSLVAQRSVSASDLLYAREVWSAWFAPFPPHTLGDVMWPWTRLVDAFGIPPFAPPRLDGGLRYALPSAYALLAVVGLASWWRRGARLAFVLVALPLVVATAASAFKLYPLGGRVTLFLLPFPMLAAAEGWDFVCRRIAVRALPRAAAAMLVLALPILAIVTNLPPFHLEHLRPVLERVRSHWQPNDLMYVYYGGGQAFLHYAPRLGFAPDDFVIGSCARSAPATYVRELDALSGRPRVWVVFTHSTSEGVEYRLLRDYLDRRGVRRLSIEVPAEGAHAGSGAYAYLYDLSQPVDNVALASDAPLDLWAWACYGTMSPQTVREDSDGL